MLEWFKKLLGIKEIPRISVKEAQEKIKGGAVLIDVRSPLERKARRIPGAQSYPLADLSKQWEKLPKNKPIICQCESGGRSAQAADFLIGKGLEVYNLAGGISSWEAAGLPIKKGDIRD